MFCAQTMHSAMHVALSILSNTAERNECLQGAQLKYAGGEIPKWLK